MSTSQKITLWYIIRIILSLPFLVVGVFSWAWSLVCFIGGPDGRIGSPESIGFGFGFILFSVLCEGMFLLLNWKKRWALLTLGILYDGVLALLAFILTTSFFAMHLEHNVWPLPLLFAALFLWCISLVGVYGLCQLLKTPKQKSYPAPRDCKPPKGV